MAKEKGQDLATRQNVVGAGVFGKGARGGKERKWNGMGNGNGRAKGKGGSVLAGFAKRTKGARGAKAERGELDFNDELVSSETDEDDDEQQAVKDDTMKVKVGEKVGVKERMEKVRRLTSTTVFTGVSTIYPIRRWKAHDGTLIGCLEVVNKRWVCGFIWVCARMCV
jgi:hypothetical protein